MKLKFNLTMTRKAGVLSTLLIATLIIGHGCSEFSAVKSIGLASLGSGGNPEGPALPAAKDTMTVSMVYNKQILDNMVSCSGIGVPSPLTQSEWDKRQNSFSEFGYATDVTAPMLMAIAALSGEICNDLINQEQALAAADRRIFNSINFSAGASMIAQADITDVTRRLARSCWGRNETTGEADQIIAAVNGSIADGLAATTPPNPIKETRNAALFICTGVLSSLSATSM